MPARLTTASPRFVALLVWAATAGACERAGESPPPGLGAEDAELCMQGCTRWHTGSCAPTREQCASACGAGRKHVSEVDVTFGQETNDRGGEPSLLGRSIGIETLGGIATRLVERCTQLPVDHLEIFSTAADNQTSVEIHLLAGDQPMAAENRTLAKIQVTGIPSAPRGVPKVEVKLRVDRRGHLAVGARDLATGRELVVIDHER